MTALEKARTYTADEYLAMSGLPERCELIDGEIYAMSPSPNIAHQGVSMGISAEIRNFIRKNGGKCRVFAAPSDVKLDDGTVVQPDIYVVCDPDKLDEQKCNGAPDWVIEIVSPSDTKRDTIDKLKLYEAAGVREYWIVFPVEQQVLVYRFFDAPNTTGIYKFTDPITVGIYKDTSTPLIITVAEVL